MTGLDQLIAPLAHFGFRKRSGARQALLKGREEIRRGPPALMAKPASNGASNNFFHSSGVKLVFVAMIYPPGVKFDRFLWAELNAFEAKPVPHGRRMRLQGDERRSP